MRAEIDELYAEKANRDKRASELKASGFTVRKSSHRGQQLHPMYIEDRKAGLSQDECGFGNTRYQEMWPVLYQVEARKQAEES